MAGTENSDERRLKPKGSAGKLLLIDDDKEILSLFDRLLTLEGYEVDAVESGHSGLAKFGEGNGYDVVLTDLRLGDISGLDVLKAVKQCDPLISVIIMTGYASAETAMEAIRLGANDYLMKPVRSPDLLKSVLTQASNVRLAREVQSLHLEIAEERDKLKRSVTELALLKQLAERMATVVSHVGGFETIINLLIDETGADIAIVFDVERGSVRLNHADSIYLADLEKLSEIISGQCKELFDMEVSCSPECFETSISESQRGGGGEFASAITVPLAYGDEPIGLLVAVSRADADYETNWSEFVSQLAKSASEFLTGIQRSIERRHHFTASVVEHTLDGIAMLSPSTGAILTNPAMRTLLGAPPGVSPNAKQVGGLLGFDLDELWRELSVVKSDNPFDHIREMSSECVLEGKRSYLQVAVSVLPGDEHEEGALLVVTHDMTKEHAVEEMKNRLISNITHEVRTPTAVIREFMSLILDGVSGPLTDSQREYMKIMYSNIERLSRLIENLLTLARSDTGGFTMVLKPTELPEIISDVTGSMEIKLRRKNIGLTVELPDSVPLIYADPDAVTQILTNLIDNAYKYSPDNTEITITVEEQHNRVVISVVDQGYGIPEDQQDSIFERFHRLVDEDDPRFQEGVGLGLALVRDMVTRHGGDIWLVSEVGKGSRFSFSLHVAAEDKEHKPA